MATTRITAGQARKSTQLEDFADTTVHADDRVAGGKAKAMLMFRQRENGIWYALGATRDTRLVRVPMRRLHGFDRSLAGLAGMPRGKGASRAQPEASWSPCPAPPSSEQDALLYLVDILRRRIARWADVAAAMLLFPGLACAIGAGYLLMLGQAATAGASTTWAVPLGAAGAWLFVSGVATGASKRAVWAMLGALGLAACAAIPFIHPGYDLGPWRPALVAPAALALLTGWRSVRIAMDTSALRRWLELEPAHATGDQPGPEVPSAST